MLRVQRKQSTIVITCVGDDRLSLRDLRKAGITGPIDLLPGPVVRLSFGDGPSALNFARLQAAYGSRLQAEEGPEVSKPVPRRKTLPRPRYVAGIANDLFEHQKEAIFHVKENAVWGVTSRPGAGKTRVALEIAAELWSKGKIDAVVVFSVSGVHLQWLDEQCRKYIPGNIPWRGVAWNYPKRKFGTAKSERQDALTIFTVNHDAARTKRGFLAIEEFIRAYAAGRVLVIVDESHYIKNYKTERARAIRQIGELCVFRAILTGTPITRNLEDLWAQFLFLDPEIIGIKFITAFRAKYCIMGGFQGHQIVGYRNVEDLQERIAPYMFRVSQLDLPQMFDIPIEFEMSDEQIRIIRGLKKDLKAEIIGGKISAANAAVRLLRIQQISNAIMSVEKEGERVMDENPRLAALLRLLESLPEDEQAIIWVRFGQDAYSVAKALETDRFVIGETSKKDRNQIVEDFLKKKTRYLIASPPTLGTGYNLQVGGCHTAIYYSMSHNAVQRWQADFRLNRIGQSETVYNYILVAIGGIDRGIIRNHESKKALADFVLDNSPSPSLDDAQKTASLAIEEVLEILEDEE